MSDRWAYLLVSRGSCIPEHIKHNLFTLDMTFPGMQRPTIKTERTDPAHLPPSYHLQQLQQQHQQLMVQPSYTFNVQPNQGIQLQVQNSKDNTNGTENKNSSDENGETQPDFQSIKGVFGWTVIDNVNIPYILRSDQQFVSVRIVEMKLLSRYPNSYPDDLGKHAPLTSFFITKNEAKLLNEINLEHCAGEYGKRDFTIKDLIVLLSDFINFYNLVKKTFPDADAARQNASSLGSARWLQIKNTVTPYIIRPDGKYVPLSVIQYAAGLLTNENVSGVPPTLLECSMLNEACKHAGVEFVFSDSSTRLVKVDDITRISPVDMIELPSNNPLKHATYMELPTTSSTRVVEKTKTVTSVPPPKIPQLCQQPAQIQLSQPYRFQPNVSLDMIRNQIRSNISLHEQTPHLPPMSFNPSYTGNQVLDPQMLQIYRMQFPVPTRSLMPQTTGMNHILPPRYGSNMNQNQSSNINPMLQHLYQNMITNQQPKNRAVFGPLNEQSPQPTQLPMASSIDVNNRQSPRSCSNPSPRSHTPLQSRPPSGPRLPPGLPLSPAHIRSPPIHLMSPPTAHSGSSVMSGHSSSEGMISAGQSSSFMAIQHIQNMCAQHFQGAVIPGMSVTDYSSSKPSASHTNSSNILTLRDQIVSPSSTVNKTFVTDLMSPLNQIQPGQGSQPSANQEIPGLFTPTGASVTYQNPPISHILSINSDAPPPLLLIQSPSLAQSNILSQSTHTVPAMPPPRPIMQQQLLPQNISAVKQITHIPLMSSIKGAWLNNKSISCLCLEQDDRNGRFCLVEAVCKLYFNGCSVNEFLFALENVLNVPLITCTDAEEKAFIQYYSLPVDALKCNKMIKFDDLENYFPQLTYMFPTKEAIEQSDVEQESVQESGQTGGQTPVQNVITAITAAEIEAAMPTAIGNTNHHLGVKRASDVLLEEPPSKHLRERTGLQGDDCVIILD